VATEFYLRLEDSKGRPAGDAPAWTPRRQFLWEVVHDTRGVLRHALKRRQIDLIRTVDPQDGNGGPEYGLDPLHVREAYVRLRDHLAEIGGDGPAFHWVAHEGRDDWAAVHHVEAEGRVFSVFGGWNPPTVRTMDLTESDRTFDAREGLTVGGQRLRVRRDTFHDLFRDDIDRLIEVLGEAGEKGIRVRFCQS
jgi:hypothetical protein